MVMVVKVTNLYETKASNGYKVGIWLLVKAGTPEQVHGRSTLTCYV